MCWAKRTALLASALLLALWGCAAENDPARQDILTEVQAGDARTVVVSTGDVTRTATLGLAPVYAQQQSLYAPENGLYLDEVLVKAGDQVEKGQTIAVFHRESSQAELQKAELALERAQAEQEDWLEALEEAADNAEAFGGAREELARLQYDRAVYVSQRQLKALQEAVDEQKAAFEPVLLLAPYDCVINSAPHLFDQQEVDTSTVIVTVDKSSSLVLIGEDVSSFFRYGSEVEVEYGNRNARKTVKAKVVSTSLLLGEEDDRICVVPEELLDIETLRNPQGKTSYLQLRNAITVPRNAVQAENTQSYVRVLVDGVAHKRYIVRGVDVGDSSGNRRTLVLAGLEPGQTIILE